MKNIAIIGAGIAGLRATLHLCQNPEFSVTVWEKSPSVGGRVATRRYAETFVNHGIAAFDAADKLVSEDPMAQEFATLLKFEKQATELPKAMLRQIKSLNESLPFHFNQRITKVDSLGSLWVGETQHVYDHIIITAPMAQVTEMLQSPVHPEVRYSKKILFIGLEQGLSKRLELSDEFSETHFEQTDELIRQAAEKELNQSLAHLDLKKWRYCRVLSGVNQTFSRFSAHITLAGDAFDPLKIYDLKAAWLSGRKAASSLND